MTAATWPATEVIRAKRDGGELTRSHIDTFVQGLVSADPARGWSEGQIAAMAMAILLRGMSSAETADLADAMTHSGEVLDWRGAGLDGLAIDKHATGGVGDKVSLVLAPLLAAAGAAHGAFVPMVSGRGLGHTGGTLDKLEALPGYNVNPAHATLLQTLRTAGCAIVGASRSLAPADGRLYAIRDLTATVESVPLITASILSKKRAANLNALVMDVKLGSGAFTRDRAQALALAHSLVRAAKHAGLPTLALVTDMNQVLGHTAGNALEVQEAILFLTQRAGRDPRLLEVTLSLGSHLMRQAGLFPGLSMARLALLRVLDNGDAAERFARMVASLGGPADVLRNDQLPSAPVQRPVAATRAGFISAMDVRAIGLAVVALGAGRLRASDRVDPRVGLSAMVSLGVAVTVNQALCVVHAASEDAADVAVAALTAAITIGVEAPTVMPVVHEVIRA